MPDVCQINFYAAAISVSVNLVLFLIVIRLVLSNRRFADLNKFYRGLIEKMYQKNKTKKDVI